MGKTVKILPGTIFEDGFGKVRAKKEMEFEIPEDPTQLVQCGKIKTHAKDEEELKKKLNSLFPYMWRNWVNPYEDNTNGMKDWLEEHLEELEVSLPVGKGVTA